LTIVLFFVSDQLWCPTVPPLSTKQTIICHLNSLNTNRGTTRYFNILQSENCICVHCIGHCKCANYPALAQESFITIRLENLTFFSEHEVDWQDKITKNINYLPSVIFCDGNCSHIWVLTSKTSSLMSIDSSSEWNIKSKYNIAKTCMNY